MYEGKKYPLEKNLTYFLEEFTYIFLPLEIKVSAFKPRKCIFSQLIWWNGTFEFTFYVNFWKSLANKICDVIWGWEISTWRMEHSNYLPDIMIATCDACGSTCSCKNIPGLSFP